VVLTRHIVRRLDLVVIWLRTLISSVGPLLPVDELVDGAG
jgi:hypothetical protein